MSDRIVLRGLEVFARHGVYEHEQRLGQRFLVDLVLELDLKPAGLSDRVDETVDYGALAVRVHELVAGERWDLIERVAERVAEVALESDRVEAVEVTVRKPEAPIPVPFEEVSVTVRRNRT